MDIIATISSPFTEKFGIPRQSNLVDAGQFEVVFKDEFSDLAFIKDIEQHSHIWLLFLFHENLEQGWKPSVRPPRLGGNKKTGVFATRSSFRPNGIGMSAVKLISVDTGSKAPKLIIESADLLDGTPIVDIKPYIPYSDCITEATSAMAIDAPEQSLEIVFDEVAMIKTTELQSLDAKYQSLEQLIRQVLSQDPRPAYKKNKADDKLYGIKLYDLDIKWRVDNGTCYIIDICHPHKTAINN